MIKYAKSKILAICIILFFLFGGFNSQASISTAKTFGYAKKILSGTLSVGLDAALLVMFGWKTLAYTDDDVKKRSYRQYELIKVEGLAEDELIYKGSNVSRITWKDGRDEDGNGAYNDNYNVIWNRQNKVCSDYIYDYNMAKLGIKVGVQTTCYELCYEIGKPAKQKEELRKRIEKDVEKKVEKSIIKRMQEAIKKLKEKFKNKKEQLKKELTTEELKKKPIEITKSIPYFLSKSHFLSKLTRIGYWGVTSQIIIGDLIELSALGIEATIEAVRAFGTGDKIKQLACATCGLSLVADAARIGVMIGKLTARKGNAMDYYDNEDGSKEVKLCGSSINYFYLNDSKKWKRFLCNKNSGIRNDSINERSLINNDKCKLITEKEKNYSCNHITNKKTKKYRECYYGGVEYKDNRENSLKNPVWPSEFKDVLEEMFFGQESGKDAYFYMRGPAVKQGYHCDRFDNISCNYVAQESAKPMTLTQCNQILNVAKRFKEECQKKERICLERGVDEAQSTEGKEYKFCNKGEECDLNDEFSFKTYKSVEVQNYICAMTTSFCPYDYPIGGGTEEKLLRESIDVSNKNNFVNDYCKKFHKSLDSQKCKACYNIGSESKLNLNDKEKLQARMACVKCAHIEGEEPEKIELNFNQDVYYLNNNKCNYTYFSQENNFKKLFTIKYFDPGSDKAIISTIEYFSDPGNDKSIISKTNAANNIEAEIADGDQGKIHIIYNKNHSDKNINLYNFPQYLKHCTKKSFKQSSKFIKSAEIGFKAPESCTNMRGSSHNVSQNRRHYHGHVEGTFSAPIVECFRDMIAEVFFNTASRSICANGEPTQGICNDYKVKKGEKITEKSFFNVTQGIFGWFVKFSLIFSVIFFGLNTLYGGGIPKKKDFLMFIVKVAFVTYFALGTGWKDIIYDGLYNFGHGFYDVIFDHLSTSNSDGCQFPRYNDLAGSTVNSYPKGKEYLKIWDTLDCKLSLIFNVNLWSSVADGVMIYFISFLGGASNYGLLSNLFQAGLQVSLFFKFIHSVLTLTIMLLLVSIIVKLAYVFISYSFMISMLIFISPITISCILFKKSEKIFSGWKDHVISFALQPLMLLIYISLMLTIYDRYMIGDAAIFNNFDPKADYDVGDIVNCSKAQNSVYCDLDFHQSAMPSIVSGWKFVVSGEIMNLLKMAIIMFLLYGILDQVLKMAAKLTKGKSIKTDDVFDIEESYKAISKLEGNVAKGTQTALESIRVNRDEGQDSRVSIPGEKDDKDSRLAVPDKQEDSKINSDVIVDKKNSKDKRG